MKETLNGNTVLATFVFLKRDITRGGRVIIVQRENAFQPFVCAVQFETDGVYDNDWAYGQYVENMFDAYQFFIDRIKRFADLLAIESTSHNSTKISVN